jgi:hypothetical protein
MGNLDRMIETTLNEEDRAFLAKLDREPGYFSQVGGLLAGSLGWVNLLMMIVQAVMFFGGAVLVLTAALLKVCTLWPTLQANRVLREVKRLELQIARAERK